MDRTRLLDRWMDARRFVRTAVVVAVGMTVLGGRCLAQTKPSSLPSGGGGGAAQINPKTGLPGEMLEELNFERALAKANRTSRVLVVFIPKGRTIDIEAMRERCFRNQTLHAYLMWHCVAIQSNDLPEWAWKQIERKRQAQTNGGAGIRMTAEYPAVVCFRGRDLEATVWTWRVQMTGTDAGFGLGIGGASNSENARGGKSLARFERPWHVPAPNDVVLQTDLAVERCSAKDPIWGETHARMNPPPPAPPEPEPLCWTDSVSGPMVRDPDPGDKELGTGLDRLAHARALVRSGDMHRATGYYSWLWERAERLDPAFRPARLGVLIDDLKALRQKRPGADDHLQQLREREQLQHPWADYPRWADLVAINSGAGEEHSTIELLDRALNDKDEAAILPRADARVWDLLLRSADATPRELLSHLSTTMSMIGRPPKSATAEQSRQLDDFLRDHARNIACRAYAGLLANGRDAEAMEAARALLEMDNSALSKAALVTTALAMDPAQAREHQKMWAKQAGAADPRWMELESAIDRGLAATR